MGALKLALAGAEGFPVDQLSKPLLAALAATLCLLCVWLVALRPSSEEPGAPVTPTPATQQQASAGEPRAPARDSVTAKPAKADVDAGATRRAARVLGALDKGRTVVLLFWNGRSPDDRATRRAVARVDRLGGKVRVVVERLSRLGAYAPITNGVRVVQSPTTLVIDRERRAQAIAGYTVTSELDQAVADARGRR